MKTTFMTAVFAATTLLALTPAAFAGSDTPSVDDIEFHSFETDGSACEGENMFANIVSESDAYTADVLDFAFGDVKAKSNPKKKKRELAKDCQIDFVMTYPRGYRFTIEYVTFSGYVNLKTGQNGLFKTRLGGGLNKASRGFDTMLVGPVRGEFDGGRTMRVIEGFRTSCSGKARMSVYTSISILGNPALRGQIRSSKKSGYLNQSFRLKWHKC